MKKACIYYTDNKLDPVIMRVCQEQLRFAFQGDIISVSLAPINFGKNYVFPGERGILTMYYQILLGLLVSPADTIFLTEHDVLYHSSHFDFEPPDRNIYYYNVNVWRWEYPGDKAITYDYIHSLSGLCADRKLLLSHMLSRISIIESQGLDQHISREPQWARRMGYEPGTKKRRRGGPTDETYADYQSEYPDIDIRHPGTYSPPKTRLSEYKHPPDPDNWHEININNIPGWENVKGRFI